MIHKCKTHKRQWCWRCVWFTLGFPIEHVLWEKTPYLRLVLPLLGIH